MANTSIVKNQFNFRSKFKKVLNESNSLAFCEAFSKFCSYEPKEARDFLWKLTYDKEKAWESLQEIGITEQLVNPKNIIDVRNELRHQYKEVHNDFLKEEMPKEIEQKYNMLEKHSDIIVANVLLEHCSRHLYRGDEWSEKTISLLESPKENNYFGGIRRLGFYKEEALYLKAFKDYIHDLLSELYEYKNKNESFSKNMPLKGLDELIKENGVEQEHDEIVQEEIMINHKEKVDEDKKTIQINSEFEHLNAEKVLENLELFKTYVKGNDMNVLFLLGQKRFDLNQVFSKKVEIKNLINAIEALNA